MSLTTLLSRRPSTAEQVHARAADDTPVELRPLRPGEGQALQAVFDGLSPASRRGRYLMAMPHLSAPAIRVLTDVDGDRHIAWLASVDGRPAGIARCIRVAPGAAEIAYEVVDAHQGRGLGSVLLDTITTVARSRRISWLEATVHPGNRPSIVLLHKIGLTLRLEGGLLEGSGRFRLLERPLVDRKAVVTVAARNAAQVTGNGSCASPAHAAD